MHSDHHPPTPPGGDDLMALFRLATRLLARAHHHPDRAGHAQRHVLGMVLAHGPINQADLLAMLDIRSSSLSEVLGKLEQNGLIERQRNESDRRGLVIQATERARGPEDAPLGGDPGDDPLACLTPEERQQLRGILQKIVGSLKDRDAHPQRPGWGGGFGGGRGGRGGHGPHGRGPGRGRGHGGDERP